MAKAERKKNNLVGFSGWEGGYQGPSPLAGWSFENSMTFSVFFFGDSGCCGRLLHTVLGLGARGELWHEATRRAAYGQPASSIACYWLDRKPAPCWSHLPWEDWERCCFLCYSRRRVDLPWHLGGKLIWYMIILAMAFETHRDPSVSITTHTTIF